MTGTEHEHQVTVVAWAQLNVRKYPVLRCLHAIPNGGKRDIRVARKLKLEGVRAGVMDLNLPIPRGECCGLWIEMKSGDNDLTPAQWEWGMDMMAAGHRVAVCWSAGEAIAVLEEYLEGKCRPIFTVRAGATAPSSSSRRVRA